MNEIKLSLKETADYLVIGLAALSCYLFFLWFLGVGLLIGSYALKINILAMTFLGNIVILTTLLCPLVIFSWACLNYFLEKINKKYDKGDEE